MKFLLFVEGQTERASLAPYLKKWMDPKLKYPVRISAIRFHGWAELRKECGRRARLHLEGRGAAEIIGIISLIDLHGPTYPPDKVSVDARFGWIKNQMETSVDQPKFRQFCAVHEIEAWLLSQPDLFPELVKGAFPSTIEYPEKVNFEKPPSRLLSELYSRNRRTYKKIVDGRNLFAEANPETGYAKCPHLKLMLDEMLKMAHEAGL